MYQFFQEKHLDKEMSQGRLFWLEDVNISRCTFTLFPREALQISYLRVLIEKAGGIVVENHGPQAIPLVDQKFLECTIYRDSNKSVPNDHFSSKFIYDCVVANKILDLNKYRCTESNYEEFDSNDILMNKLEWTQLSLKKVGQNLPGTSTSTGQIRKTLSPSGTSTVKNLSGKTALVSVSTENESVGGSTTNAVNGGDGIDGAGEITTPGKRTRKNFPRWTPSDKSKEKLKIMTDTIAMEESDDELEVVERPVAPKIRPAWIRRNAMSKPKDVAFSIGERNAGVATRARVTQSRSAGPSTREPFRQLTETNGNSANTIPIPNPQDADEVDSIRDGGQSVPSFTTTNESGVENEIRGQVTPPLSLENFYPVVAVAVAGPSTRNGIAASPAPTENLGVSISVSVTDEGQGETFAGTSDSSTRRSASPVASTSRRAGGENVTPVTFSYLDFKKNRLSVPYLTKDGRAILGVIIRKEWYDNYKTKSIWTEMEEMDLFHIHRRWVSIRTYFLKKVLPNLHLPKYRLTPENLLSFQNSKYNREPPRRYRKRRCK